MEVNYDQDGDQTSILVKKEPVSGITYEVPLWIMYNGKRRKTYRSELFTTSLSVPDSGTVVFDQGKLTVLNGRFAAQCKSFPDPYYVGEKPVRENAGGLYLKFGIKSVTMDYVAQELGISKKTLYHYFKNKADLISQVVDYYLDHPVFDLNDSKHGNAIDRYFILRKHIIGILKYYNIPLKTLVC